MVTATVPVSTNKARPAPQIDQLLNQLARQRFFGTLEIKLESGKVVLVRKTETIKPSEMGENCWGNQGDNNADRRQY